ncbi:MAG: agmatine deiminase family protein [Bacteroidia bacterium]
MYQFIQFLSLLMGLCLISACGEDETPIDDIKIEYIFPEESEPHEGTWLQWPHQYQYGIQFRNRLDETWIDICRELVEGENVHIIAYNETEKTRIEQLLDSAKVTIDKIDFFLFENDDFWIRDNGPIFTKNLSNELIIQNWGFNGWGKKANFKLCNQVPSKIGQSKGFEVINIEDKMINEGGSVELDGHGTLMACKSSILNRNRNPGMSQLEAEKIFKRYLGVTNFVWLEGQAGLEITDQHIDGFARFGNANTIVTMAKEDLLAYDVLESDIETLYNAKNKDGEAYNFLYLPLTQNNVSTKYGENLGYKGSYCNYYIGNTKVLVPTYKDANDKEALQILQGLYPNRTVVGIDCRNVYANGGMIHCVTQQQPE